MKFPQEHGKLRIEESESATMWIVKYKDKRVGAIIRFLGVYAFVSDFKGIGRACNTMAECINLLKDPE